MSDQWEYYPCQMGENLAFIFYDHGIRDAINDLAQPNSLKIRVQFQKPNDAGLPSNEEFEQLSALEDRLTARIEERGGVYVGRISVAGTRHFRCFVPFMTDAVEHLLSQVSADSGYDLQFELDRDPDRKAYWEDLFPTDEDWCVVQDMKVLDVLKERGDDTSIVRRVDHWVYFPDAARRDLFAAWAVDHDFTIEQ